jgi:hypothetical protein
MKWSDFDRWLKAEHLQGKARALTIDQVVIEEVYSQAEKRNRPAPVLYFRETKKGLVLSGPNQDALQGLFGDDVAACFGAKVLLEPVPMRVAGRELVVIRLKAAPGSNGTGPKQPAAAASGAAAPGEKGKAAGPDAAGEAGEPS